MSNNGENSSTGDPADHIADQVTNITLAALRDMRFDSPPGSAMSVPVSSPHLTPVSTKLVIERPTGGELIYFSQNGA